MALKKSELYSSLWKSCDELRGGMDASQYKDYVLILLFVKYVSDKYASDPHALIDVPDGGSFADMVALKGDKEIGDKINKIIGHLADVNDSLKGAINIADFNNEEKLGKGKEMVDRLTKLVAIFEGLNFGRNRAEGDDLLGDAYEYLMRHFATESGKSKGQFYTPAEVSRIMAQVLGLNAAHRADQSIYDPTCGSGSLLLKAHDEAKSRTGLDLALYGQEMDNATSALARMNMVLHDCPTAEIWQSNTLTAPHFKNANGRLKTFDFMVANPPFSNKNWTSGLDPANDLYDRFEYGIPPAKNGDYAFLLHMLASLKSTGKGAVILPHGVLFRGNTEGNIRKRIVQQGYIKGIIGLPTNLFYGTGIPACVLVLDKEHSAGRAAGDTGIFMIDASKGFIKDGNKNRLRAQDIHKIVDIFTRQMEIAKYSRMVPLAEIEANEFNLNLPRYIDSTEAEDLQDIEAHLKGGIPNRDVDNLAAYWEVFPGVRHELFAPFSETGERADYSRLKVEIHQVESTIFSHPEFVAFNEQVSQLFMAWKAPNIPLLTGIQVGDRPKALIEALSESLLEAFRSVPLIDPYDVYQHLMDYWAETMQDDAWMIVTDGWKAIQDGKPNIDLIPPALVVARYLAAEQADVEQLEAERGTISRQMEEMDEEHGSEDGLLAEAKTEKGKLTAKSVKDRLKAIKHQNDKDGDAADERKVLEAYLTLIEQEATASKQVKDAQMALDNKVAAKYGKLSEAEIKTLVVDDKWLAALEANVQSELARVIQTLAGRVKQLAERYTTPLPTLIKDVESLAARVHEHLKKMGFVWEKCDLKQAAVQQQPTDRTRVSEFSGEWIIKQLGTIGSFSKGRGLAKEDISTAGDLPAVPYTAIYTDHNEVIQPTRIRHFAKCMRNLEVISSPRLLIASSSNMLENIGKVTAFSGGTNLAVGGDVLLYQTTADVHFLSYLMSTTPHRRRVVFLSQGSTIHHVYASTFQKYEILLPPLEEQTAIASVLSDVDAEIAALEARCDKARALKQGMMQALLTGSTRLKNSE